MRKNLRNYFIGHFLQTDDVFEIARAIMVYRFTIMFTVIFIIPLVGDITMNLHKAIILHSIDLVALLSLPMVIKRSRSLDLVILLFFSICFISNFFAFMILNPMKLETTAFAWSAFFLSLSALLLKGKTRILFCGILFWLPMMYVFVNIGMNGALTVNWLTEKVVADPPIYIMTIPIILSIKAITDYTATMEEAKQTIFVQKALIEQKNKEMTDSITYAKRIQDSLLPNEKVIERNLDELKHR